MEKNEPKLAPEWLKSVGNKPASSSASSLQSGVYEASKYIRSRPSSVNDTGHNLVRPLAANHATISHSHRNSNRSSSDHPLSYSNFGRNRRSRDRYIDKYENSVHPDVSRKNSGNMNQKDEFRHSKLMTSERHAEKWIRNSCSGENSNRSYSNDLPDNYGLFNTVPGSESERGLLLHGAERRQIGTGIRRVRSPSVITETQSTMGSFSAAKTGDKWTSLLAEVPSTSVSDVPDGSGSSPVQIATSFTLPTMSTPTGSGFNMAEAVAKSPRVQTTSQLSNGNQRFEDLAIKQSRILIPVTPSAPKTTALNPSDRIKSKVAEQRQQHHLSSSSHLASHVVRTEGLATSDALKTCRKLLVLKPTRDKNGVSSGLNNCSDLSRDMAAIKPVLSPGATVQRSGSNPVSPTAESKHVQTVAEKKLSSQARSRSDFFNLMRKKSMGDTSAVAPDISTSHATQDQDSPSPNSQCVSMPVENINEDTGKNDAFDGKSHPGPDPLLCSEEEEAAFLRSLGWEENADEGGLTEEEISTFYRDVTKYINSKLPLKILQGVQPRLLLTLNS